MTASVSGFLAPEERAALEQQKRVGAPARAQISDAILRALDGGPLTLNELIAEVSASPRVILSAIDDLEPSHLVATSYRNDEEVINLTAEGRKVITP